MAKGATKQVSVHVEGATSDASAFRIAKAIADSPLVKTAIAGEDANWGRVVMAVGKAGEPADRDKLSIRFGDLLVAKDGERAAGYDEAATSAYMKGEELEVTVNLGLGDGHGDGLYLRPHPWLHHHQRRLSQLMLPRPGSSGPILSKHIDHDPACHTDSELAFLAAWPALEEIRDHGWVARFSRGYSKRANCIQCMDPEDEGNAAARIDALVGSTFASAACRRCSG